MANLSDIRIALASWANLITATNVGDLDGLPVHWRKTRSVRMPGGVGGYVELYISTFATLGRDELRFEQDLGNPGSEITYYQRGQRTFIVEIRVITRRQSNGVDAYEYIERIRDRLQLPSLCAILETADVAFNSIAAETDLTEIEDDRVKSAVQLDLKMNTASDVADLPTTFIETMDVETEYLNTDGSPASQQFTGKIEVG